MEIDPADYLEKLEKSQTEIRNHLKGLKEMMAIMLKNSEEKQTCTATTEANVGQGSSTQNRGKPFVFPPPPPPHCETPDMLKPDAADNSQINPVSIHDEKERRSLKVNNEWAILVEKARMWRRTKELETSDALNLAPDRHGLQSKGKKPVESAASPPPIVKTGASAVKPPHLLGRKLDKMYHPNQCQLPTTKSAASTVKPPHLLGRKVDMAHHNLNQYHPSQHQYQPPTAESSSSTVTPPHLLGRKVDNYQHNLHQYPNSYQYQPPCANQAAFAPPIPQWMSSQVNQPRKAHRQRRKERIDPIPYKYTELLPQLIERGLIATRPYIPVRQPYPDWYNPSLKCDFHRGAIGHPTEKCHQLHVEVQNLVRNGSLKFPEEVQQNEGRNSPPNQNEFPNNPAKEVEDLSIQFIKGNAE